MDIIKSEDIYGKASCIAFIKHIISSMWWSVATFTTVGYGDVYPITSLGKFFGSLSAIFGVGLFAIPSGILASGFVEHKGNYVSKCPHCGETIVY